jgi:hypothetical protein
MGQAVWNRFPDFGRVLLPLGVLSLLALVPALSHRAPTALSAGADGPEPGARDLVSGTSRPGDI